MLPTLWCIMHILVHTWEYSTCCCQTKSFYHWANQCYIFSYRDTPLGVAEPEVKGRQLSQPPILVGWICLCIGTGKPSIDSKEKLTQSIFSLFQGRLNIFGPANILLHLYIQKHKHATDFTAAQNDFGLSIFYSSTMGKGGKTLHRGWSTYEPYGMKM